MTYNHEEMSRRKFLGMMGAAGITLAGYSLAVKKASADSVVRIEELVPDEDVFAYILRVKGGFDQTFYQQLIGASNEFKEGDQTIRVGAKDEKARQNARTLLANTTIKDLCDHPLLKDNLQKLIWETTDKGQYEKVKDWTLGQLKHFF